MRLPRNWLDLQALKGFFMVTPLKFLNLMTARQGWVLLLLGCVGPLGFALYLQHVVGLEPCPMCIVQRYAMTVLALIAVIGSVVTHKKAGQALVVAGVLSAGFGAFVAARQSWLQWYPPNIVSCGRDFYGMIEAFPLQRTIPLIFRGSGDCTKIDWTFLGGSIANWTFLVFLGMAIWLLAVVWRKLGQHTQAANDDHFQRSP
jgi:protein dithiol:quinone oxidoreductase